MMKTFRVTFTIVLEDEASPRKWVRSSVEECLEEGEFIDDFEFHEFHELEDELEN